MAGQIKVRVLRHLNGGEFEPGAIRTLNSADASRLAASGAVKILGPAKPPRPPQAKKAPAPKNKAAPAPQNKTEG